MIIKCLQCGTTITDPKIYKNVTVQKFCKPTCRWSYHNKHKVQKQIKDFLEDLTELLKKHGLTD